MHFWDTKTEHPRGRSNGIFSWSPARRSGKATGPGLSFGILPNVESWNRVTMIGHRIANFSLYRLTVKQGRNRGLRPLRRRRLARSIGVPANSRNRAVRPSNERDQVCKVCKDLVKSSIARAGSLGSSTWRLRAAIIRSNAWEATGSASPVTRNIVRVLWTHGSKAH